jgi:autotransporter-associated beta strand protein
MSHYRWGPLTSTRRSLARRHNAVCRPRLEFLEDRTAPAAHTWSGASGIDLKWSNASNWQGNFPPQVGETSVTLNFPSVGANNKATEDDLTGGPLVVDEINFTDSGYSINGAPGISLTFTGMATLSSITDYVGGNSVNLPITLTGDDWVQVAAGSDTLTGALNGSGSLTKAGSGILLLTGANTYSGTTTGSTIIRAGTLRVGSASALPSAAEVWLADDAVTLDLNNFSITIGSLKGYGNVTLGSGTLSIGAGDSYSLYNGIISGTGGLTKLGSDTLTLTGANAYSGPTTISAGRIQVGYYGTTGSLGAGPVTNNGSIVFDHNDAITVPNAINGSGRLEKDGDGTLLLTGANTYSGSTDIYSGTLRVGGASALPSAAAVWLRYYGGATLDLNNYSITIGSLDGSGGNVTLGSGTLSVGADNTSTTFGGVISGTGGLTKVGSGTLTLEGASTYSGSTTVSAGGIEVGGGWITGSLGTGPVTNNSWIRFDRSDDITVPNAISGSGRLAKDGAGILLLTGANTYSGSTDIVVRTLRVGSASALPSASAVWLADIATLDLNNFSITIGSLAGGGRWSNVTLGSGTLSVGADNTSTTYSGVISGAGGLTKVGSGTLTLGGVNTYAGPTVISAGQLLAGVPNAIPSSSPLITTGGLVFDATGTVTVANPISGSGTLTQAGNGTLVLTGSNSYSGGTIIRAGTLQIDNDNELGASTGGLTLSGGTLQTVKEIASNRTLTVTANSGLNIAPGTTLTLGGTLGGGSNLTKSNTGSLTLAGSGTYAGTLTFADGSLLVNGSVPSASVVVSHDTVVAGTGAIGTLSNPEGGILRPGTSAAAGNGPGTLSTGPNTNLAHFTYEVDLSGSSAGQYDSLQINGDADLGGAALAFNISPAFASSLHSGVSVPVVSTRGTLRGTFANLPNNSLFTKTVDGKEQLFRINYSESAATITAALDLTLKLAPLWVGDPVSTMAGTLSASTILPAQLALPSFSLPGGAAPDNSLFRAGETQIDGTAGLWTQSTVDRLSYTILVQVDWYQYAVQRQFTLQAYPPLTVAITPLAGQPDPCSGPAVYFTVVFSHSVQEGDFTAAAVALGGTAGPGQVDVRGSGTTYTVAVSRLSHAGTVTATIPAGRVHDGNGTANQAAPAPASVAYSPTAPPAKLLAAANAFAHSKEHYTQFVTDAYAQYLKRTPDAYGLNAWVSGMLAGLYSDERVEADFLNSVEYVSAHHGIGADWLLGMYHDLLGRTTVGADEVAGWLAVLAGGVAPTDVAYGFAASQERETERVLFNYQTYLGRANPGADEVAGWVSAYLAGTTNESMVAGFVGSPEYYKNPQKGQSDKATWVQQAYLDVLFRAGSPGEIDNWVQFLLTP